MAASSRLIRLRLRLCLPHPLLSAAAEKQNHHPPNSAAGGGKPNQYPPLLSAINRNFPLISAAAAAVKRNHPPLISAYGSMFFNPPLRMPPLPSPPGSRFDVEPTDIVGVSWSCGASFLDGKHECAFRENEIFAQFRRRMAFDRYKYGKRMYKCPARGCEKLCRTPLELHLHYLQHHS